MDKDNIITIDGRKLRVIDELCYCGARKSVHNGLKGHGACPAKDCQRFTWKAFITEPVKRAKKG